MRIPPAIAFLGCTLIWGSTWVAIKIGYDGLDAVWGASLRFLLAGGILLAYSLARGLPLPRSRRHLLVVAFVGLVMFAFDYGLIYWGEQYLASGLAAILFATMPLFVAFFAAILIPHERMTATQIAGTILGFLGVVVIFLPDFSLGWGTLLPSLAIVASAAAAGITSVVVRRFAYDLKPIALNASAMFLGGLVLMAASALLGESLAFPATTRAWTSLLYLVILGSILSFFLYWNLLKEWPAQRAGLIPIATPVVALVSGFLLNSEILTLLQVLGSTIVILGVALSLLPVPFARPVAVAAPK